MTFQSFIPFTPETVNNFQLTATELGAQVFAELGMGQFGEGTQPEYYNLFLTQINLVVMEMITQGLHINTYKTGTLFLQPQQETYVIEDEYATNLYYKRQLTNDVAAGDIVMPVDNAVTVTVGDYIGVTLDNGYLFWTTVFAKDVINKTVTLSDVIPSAATTGNYLLNYTTQIRQIKRIHQFWRTDSYVNDVPITMISRQEYDVLPYKTASVASGLPSQAYYDRSLPKGTLKLWTPPQNATYIVNFWYECVAAQMMVATDLLDFDPTYLPAVIKWTAYRLGNTFGISTERYQRIKAEAEELMESALSFDDEQTPVKISLSRET